MARFRNERTGMEFEMDGRWADHIRTRPGIRELGVDGDGTANPEPAPVSESDPALPRLRKADLQAALADAGESTEGSKAELAARLARAHGEPA